MLKNTKRFLQSASVVQKIFDRNVKRMQRDRAARHPDAAMYDYLREEAAKRLVDRLDDTIVKFPLAVDLGCAAGHVRRNIGDRGGVEMLIQCDSSEHMLRRAMQAQPNENEIMPPAESLIVDEEHLPFAPASLDLVVSNLALHWVNDLPGCFQQIRKILRPNGLFLASVLGGTTLNELRTCIVTAEQERGGVGVHVSPMLGIADAGNLVGGAGFALPTADVDTVTISYKNMFELLTHLKGMGESNAIIRARYGISRDVLKRANEIYLAEYPSEDGGVVATFQILYVIGWVPHESQPKPKERGSASLSLKDLPGSRHGTL